MRGFLRQPLARGREGLEEIEISIDLARSRRRDRAAGTGAGGGVGVCGEAVLEFCSVSSRWEEGDVRFPVGRRGSSGTIINEIFIPLG